MQKMAILLHDIRSAHNVGSIFRTADAAAVEAIYLSGFTPAPIDRFGRPQKDIAKTALGAECTVPWKYAVSPYEFLEGLKKEGWCVIGIEQDSRALNYRSYSLEHPSLFLFGNEVEGLSKELLEQCDVVLEIPMHGLLVREDNHAHHTGAGKESLNVSVAAGIVLFSALNN